MRYLIKNCIVEQEYLSEVINNHFSKNIIIFENSLLNIHCVLLILKKHAILRNLFKLKFFVESRRNLMINEQLILNATTW